MQKLIASKTMRYATRMLSAGDDFTASARDARLLIALKRAAPYVPPAPEPMIEQLREQAVALGIDVDKRWGDRRLKEEIEKARA